MKEQRCISLINCNHVRDGGGALVCLSYLPLHFGFFLINGREVHVNRKTYDTHPSLFHLSLLADLYSLTFISTPS